jgi:hypothetical protein
MDPIIFAQLNEAYHNGVYEKKELEPDPFGRPGGKHGGVPAPGSGYDRAWKAIQKKNKENKKNTNEELDIQEWVEALIEEGYNLDEYSDDELYEAYLVDLDEATIRSVTSSEGKKRPLNVAKANPAKNLSGVEWQDAAKTSGDIKRGKEGSSFSPEAQRRARTRGQEQVSRSRQGRTNMGASYITRGLQRRFAIPDSALDPADRSKDIPRRVSGIREQVDLYDLVSEYLVSEGFCDSYEDADVIMVNMSEEWRDGILEEVLDEADIIDKGLSRPVLRQVRNDRIRDEVSSRDPKAHTELELEKSRRVINTIMRGTKKPEARSRPGPPGKYAAMQRRGMSVGDQFRKEVLKRKLTKEETDLYDIILSHLLDEGFADTEEAATVIMVNMSEEWRDGILDEVTGGGKIKFRKGLPGRSPKKAGMEMTPQQKAALRLGKMDVNPSTDPARRERQAKVALR